jgi:hypothetical protein
MSGTKAYWRYAGLDSIGANFSFDAENLCL